MDVLLIGLGRWGEKHLRVLRELGVGLWVADVSPARLEWAVKQGVHAAHAVADYRAALPAVDAGAGAPRAETPAAPPGARGLQVGHIFRFPPVTVPLRQALAAGRLGAVRYATGRFSGFKRPRTDVGVTQTDAIHYFDLFAHLLGRPATRVTALQRDYLGRGLDDLSVAIVFYGEIPAVVEANYFTPGTWRDCVLVGERGALVADYGGATVTLHLGEHVKRGEGGGGGDAGKGGG